MIKYYKLFDLLNRKEIKKTELVKRNVIHSSTLSKLTKGEHVSTKAIDSMCEFLHCQPGDIMEYVYQEHSERAAEKCVKGSECKESSSNKLFYERYGYEFTEDEFIKLAENKNYEQACLELKINDIDKSNHIIDDALTYYSKLVHEKRKEIDSTQRELRKIDNESDSTE